MASLELPVGVRSLPESVPRRREDQVAARVVDDSVVLYDLKHQRVHILNQTAAAVWYLCTGERRAAEIVDEVMRGFPAGRAMVEEDVADILLAFANEHLLCA